MMASSEEELPAEEQESEDAAHEEDCVQLPANKAMQPDTVSELLGARATRFVIVGGPFDSGKTTLISSIFERLHRNTIGSWQFAWSETLLDLEDIGFKGRDASGLNSPVTERTSQQVGRKTYHIRFFNRDSGRVQDILLVDISGEEFEAVRDFNDKCEELQFIRRADHFCFLLDGDRLAVLDKRNEVLPEATTILRALSETKTLLPSTHLQIVVSKFDSLLALPAQEAVNEYLAVVESTMRSRFQDKVASISFVKTIARCPAGSTEPATGIELLLPVWCNQPRIPRRYTAPDITLDGYCEFDRFSQKTLANSK